MFYLTEGDAAYLQELADKLKVIGPCKSRSSLISSIMEKLIEGGFSGATFFKVGWQMADKLAKCPATTMDLFTAVRPLSPLFDHDDAPTEAEIVPFLEGINKQIRKENAK